MSAPILFVAAEPRECIPWVSRWQDVRKIEWPVHWARSGTWQGREMIAVANGAGWDRAADAVRCAVRTRSPAAVYNIGFCGALDDTLGIGEIFVASEIYSDRGCFRAVPVAAVSAQGVSARVGRLASIFQIAQTAGQKQKLRVSGAQVVEMEAAGAAGASNELGLPFHCVRAISDLAGESFANDFNKYLMKDGRFNIPRLMMGALQDPVTRFRELLRLSKRTTLAARNLGDFLATCNY